VLLAVFVAIERRSRHPMLDLTLFRKPAFNGVSAVAFCLSAGMFAMFLYLTIYLQGVLAYEPLQAGLRFLPLSMISFVVAPIAARLGERIPARVILGAGLATVGVGLLLMRGLGPGSEWTALLAGLIVAGTGIGIANPGIGSAAIAVVPVAKSGMGSGINTTFRQVGIATGVAALGAVFQSRVDSRLGELLPRAPKGLGELVSSGGSQAAASVTPPGARSSVVNASTIAFTSGLNEILLIAGIVCLTGAVLGFALTRSSDFVQHGGPPDEPEAAEAVGDPVRA
jgi:hypothetical protein